MKKNNDTIKNIFHVINFLAFARNNLSSLKNKKLKEKELKKISMLEDFHTDIMKRYKKNGDYLTKDEMNKFLVLYQSCSLLYDLEFREFINGKEFHLQFDYSQK